MKKVLLGVMLLASLVVTLAGCVVYPYYGGGYYYRDHYYYHDPYYRRWRD